VVSRSRVIDGACRHFQRQATVDMPTVASELAVSRATLYRVVGSRDALLGDVLDRLSRQMFLAVLPNPTPKDIDGVLELTRQYGDQVLANEPFRRFLRVEPQTAARVLFTPTGGVHRRAVKVQRAVLAGVRPGWPEEDLDGLAYLYVRLIESGLYAELLAERRPDLDRSLRAARALLLAG
jgi:AcrR family transcriptional regulator